jgi:hypothetical protein
MKQDRGGLAALIILFSIVFIDSAAQSVGNYSVTRNTGISYNSIISSGSSFSGWRYSGPFSEDDNRSVATDIGFDFWYNGTRYTQFSVSTNGFMDFSSSVDDGGPQCDDYGYCNFQFSSTSVTTGTWLALAPFYDDMTTAGGSDPLGTSIKYLVTGTAPNRVLTVEWIGMAVYLNTTPDVNFQVKLYETSGRIEYLYGSMNNGTNTYSYTIGLNASSISNPPTAAQLLTQQSANSATFNNSPQNNLSAMPAANSRISFVPPTPANPTGNLTFSGVSNTGMTLNWTDWATNETGYVLYYSTDGTNYFYQTQTAANATSTVITGLLPSTTYYWRVYAATEGTLSQPLSNNTSTLAPGTVISVITGNWNDPGTWDCNCIPTSADNVIVDETHTVRIRNGNANSNDLTIGGGTSGRLRFVRNNARTLDVNGNLVINAGATLEVRTNSNTTHTLNARGNITNNGTLQLAADANSLCLANFTKVDGDQLISGNGTTNQFYTININKNLKSNVLEVTSTNFSCDPDALNFTSGGTFKFSSAGTNSFSLFSSARTIPANGSIWMNSTLGALNFPASVTVQGDLRLDDGVINIGDASDENLISNGGTISLNGGTLNIAGQLTRSTTESTTFFHQTNGILNVPTVGSTSTTEAPFAIDVIGSEMNVSGGTIVLLREGGNGANDLGINTSGVTLSNITGGTLQIGDAGSPAAQNMGIELGAPIGNLFMNSANVTATLQGNDITVLNDVTLSSGTLNDNGLEINLSGDWLVSGGLYQTSVNGAVNFVGGSQSITSAGTSFSNLNILGSGVKSVVDNLGVSGDLTIVSELGLSIAGLEISIGGDWINNGTFTRNSETILFNGAAEQSVGGSVLNEISNINVNKTGGAFNVNSQVDFYGTMEVQSATTVDFDGTGSGIFRLISSATDDARIGQVVSGAVLTGNIIFEKYFAGQGIKYWRHIGTAVRDATIADMQTEIPISGTFTGNQNGTGVIPSFAFPSLYRYDPATGLPSETLDDRWVVYPTSTNSETFSSIGNEAQGYAIWVRDTGPTTFDLSGPANYGDMDFNISGANEGWNLVANPYPSDIDWDAATGWTKTGIQGNAIHVWNGSQYLVWNGSIGSLGNGRIAKGQGFWVQAATAGATSLASESVKTGTVATTYRFASEEMTDMPVIELSLMSNGNVDKSYIQFNKDASEDLDDFDVAKLTNAIFNFSTMSQDSVNLSINSYDASSCSFIIPLVIQNASNGDYRLHWSIDNAIIDSYQVRLFDKVTGEGQDISSTTNGIAFSVDESTSSELENRFYLEFSALEPNEDLAIQTIQDCSADGLTYISLGNTQFNYNYDLSFNDSTIVTIAGTGYEEILDITNYLKLGRNSINISGYNKSCSASRFSTVYEVIKVSQPTILYNDDLNILYEQDSIKGVWYLDNQLFSDEAVSHIVPDPRVGGVYTLMVSNDNCEFVSNEYLVTATAADLEEMDVIISPNPTAHSISINFLGYSSDSFSEIIIHDFSGRVIHSSEDAKQTIDVSDYPNGVYILTLRGSLQTISRRFIKQ